MNKNVFLLREVTGSPTDPGLHDALRAAGATRVQVNVDDEPVAPAMRLPHLDPPVTAVVSTWDGDPAAVATALHEVARHVHGYAVDVRRRLDPPEDWDGSRADALANMAILRRPAELPREEWLRRWMIEHTPIAVRTQGTFGYIQNIVTAALTPDAPQVDAIVEELFPMAAVSDIHAFYGSGGDDAELGRRMTLMMKSVERIGADRDLDLVPTSRYLYPL